MKNLLALVFSAFVCIPASFAGPVCVSGTLSSYLALGAGGCTIGADTVASFQTFGLTTGQTRISSAAITVTPSGSTSDPTLLFTVSQSVSANSSVEAIFGYSISGPAYLTDTATLSGSMETVDGAVTDIQNFCEGGVFGSDGVDGCTGPASNVLVLLDGIQNSQSATLSSPTSLSITDDLVVDGGTAGTASSGSFEDQFTASSSTPEPGTALLTLTGLAFAALCRRARIARAS